MMLSREDAELMRADIESDLIRAIEFDVEQPARSVAVWRDGEVRVSVDEKVEYVFAVRVVLVAVEIPD